MYFILFQVKFGLSIDEKVLGYSRYPLEIQLLLVLVMRLQAVNIDWLFYSNLTTMSVVSVSKVVLKYGLE